MDIGHLTSVSTATCPSSYSVLRYSTGLRPDVAQVQGPQHDRQGDLLRDPQNRTGEPPCDWPHRGWTGGYIQSGYGTSPVTNVQPVSLLLCRPSTALGGKKAREIHPSSTSLHAPVRCLAHGAIVHRQTRRPCQDSPGLLPYRHFLRRQP